MGKGTAKRRRQSGLRMIQLLAVLCFLLSTTDCALVRREDSMELTRHSKLLAKEKPTRMGSLKMLARQAGVEEDDDDDLEKEVEGTGEKKHLAQKGIKLRMGDNLSRGENMHILYDNYMGKVFAQAANSSSLSMSNLGSVEKLSGLKRERPKEMVLNSTGLNSQQNQNSSPVKVPSGNKDKEKEQVLTQQATDLAGRLFEKGPQAFDSLLDRELYLQLKEWAQKKGEYLKRLDTQWKVDSLSSEDQKQTGKKEKITNLNRTVEGEAQFVNNLLRALSENQKMIYAKLKQMEDLEVSETLRTMAEKGNSAADAANKTSTPQNTTAAENNTTNSSGISTGLSQSSSEDMNEKLSPLKELPEDTVDEMKDEVDSWLSDSLKTARLSQKSVQKIQDWLDDQEDVLSYENGPLSLMHMIIQKNEPIQL